MAQAPWQLCIVSDEVDSLGLARLCDYQSRQPDSLSAIVELRAVLRKLQAQAYLSASIDSLERKDSLLYAHLYLGEQLSWARLRNGNVPASLLRQTGFREKSFRDRPLDLAQLRQAQEGLLEFLENHGYPFAQVWLDSLDASQGQLAAALYHETGPLILFDGIETEGEVKISKAFLQSYLGIRPGSPFSRRRVLEVRDRIRELPFLQEEKNAQVAFLDEQAVVRLYLQKRKASKFDFLIGVLPTTEAGPDRRFLITGTLNAELQNQFGQGERLAVSFEQLRPGTQELELSFSYPYLLQLPFGIDLGFAQYKRDSTYNDLIFDLGIRYFFQRGNYLKAFWNRTSSRLLTIDEQRLLSTRELPEQLDLQNASFGLEYQYRQLDYRLNPRRGWSLFLRASAGFKTIEPNPAITELSDPADPEFNFSVLYDSLEERSTQYRLVGQLEQFFPLFQSSALLLRNRSGWILSPGQAIYRNEQFRIGGNRLLRGFDEESLFVTLYSVFSLEYRLLIDRNSYFYLFGDYGYIEDRTVAVRRFDRPFGFGAGLSFETRAGIFGISLAIGRQQDNPVDFRNPKVHFGYVSLF